MKRYWDLPLVLAFMMAGTISGYAFVVGYAGEALPFIRDQGSAGTVFSKNFGVRFKAHESLVWRDVPGGRRVQVQGGDSVFTDATSTADVKLSAGTQLEIAPNSLVVFPKESNTGSVGKKQRRAIHVVSGEVKVTFKDVEESPLLIEAHGKVFKFDPPAHEMPGLQGLVIKIPENAEGVPLVKAIGKEGVELGKVLITEESKSVDLAVQETEIFADSKPVLFASSVASPSASQAGTAVRIAEVPSLDQNVSRAPASPLELSQAEMPETIRSLAMPSPSPMPAPAPIAQVPANELPAVLKLRVGTGFSQFQIKGSDFLTNATGTILSRESPRLTCGLELELDNDESVLVNISTTRYSLMPLIGSRTFKEDSGYKTDLSLEWRRTFARKWSIIAGMHMDRDLFVRANSLTELAVEAVPVFKPAFGISHDFFIRKNAVIGVDLKGAYALPTSAQGFSVQSGWQVGLGTHLVYFNKDDSKALEVSVGYLMSDQPTNITSRTYQELTLGISYRWRLEW